MPYLKGYPVKNLNKKRITGVTVMTLNRWGVGGSFLALCLAVAPVGANDFTVRPYVHNPEVHNPAPVPSVERLSQPVIPPGIPVSVVSRAAVVAHAETGEFLYSKNAYDIVPIASITKLMTAMVVLDADQDLADYLSIEQADVDRLRQSSSRLPVGSQHSRADLLLLMLMSSENRAAASLARHYPGGTQAFVQAMNRKARTLGMRHTTFMDSSGLHGGNRASPADLVRMVQAAYRYPQIRTYSTLPEYPVVMSSEQVLQYRNTNRTLVENPNWQIDLSKTGFLNEAGRCLVMMTRIEDTPLIMVLLNAPNSQQRTSDAINLRHWAETALLGERYQSGGG